MKRLLLALLALGPFAAHAETGVTDSEIVLGQSAAMTGAAAELGKGMNRGAKAYFDWVNQHGGVNGRKIRLVAQDDGYEPDRAESNTRNLIDKEHVFALFGYVGTPTSNAALPLATQAKVPFFAPYTGADSMRTPFNHYVFNLRASYRDEALYVADHMTRMGMKTIDVFYQNDAYGNAGLQAMQAAAAAKGINILATATVERNSTDVSRAINELVAKNPANAVFIVSAYKSSAAFIDAAHAQHYMGPFYNVSFVGTEALVRELKSGGTGVLVSQVLPTPYNATKSATIDYQRVMKAAGSTQFDYVSLEGYMAARLMVEGLKRSGSNPTREKLISALENLGDFDMGGFHVRFSDRSHNGSGFVDLSVIDAQGKIRN